MTLDDYRWLVSDAATPWLARVRDELAAAGGPTTSLLARLRKDLSPERAHLVVEQCELRVRAREKFTLAERMFFTRKGLEQATDERIAAVKTERFPAGIVADLCCGIGGDMQALAGRSSRTDGDAVRGVELDPQIAVLAGANLRAHGCQSASTVSADAAAFDVAQVAAWHIDPDRRPSGMRTSRVELFEPPLEAVDRLLAVNAHAAIKLAPAADAPPHWREAAELCWLGSRGECRQQVAWFGALARHQGLHSATVVDAAGGARTIVGRPGEPIPVAGSLGRFVYEPHAAVLAAKVVGVLCRELAWAAVSSGVAYLTSNALIVEPACDAFEVVDVLPLDQKRLRGHFREQGIGRLEVKKRGVDVDPAMLRKAVVGDGDAEATLIVSPIAGQVRALIARRVSHAQ